MRHALATVVLGPLLLIQGRWVRHRVPRLPEPPGPRAGVAGAGSPLRLLVTGDSAAAGVGASHQSQALTGRVVEALEAHCTVTWRLEARTGATTSDTLKHLDGLEPQAFDAVVTSLGVNDLTRGVGVEAWLAQQRALRRLLRERFDARILVIAGLPPVDGFPALPQPLRWYLGRRALDFSAALRAELEHEATSHFIDLRFTLDPRLMASDGFHPGPAVYEEWGRRAAAVVQTELCT